MGRLLISADTHVKEPVDLWTSGLPEHLRALGPRVDVRDGQTCMMVEDTVIRRFRTRPQPPRGSSLVDAVESEIARFHAALKIVCDEISENEQLATKHLGKPARH